ncbi:MAG: cell division protein ZipA C-terminal FtsZ-binding domain-containing protein [bacterium]|nr:cell division protein ZipA C-terminal FtsZ-binding domain-containing protein [bacterium]
MQANWSLILNVLLLIGVIAAIGRLMKLRKQTINPERSKPNLSSVDSPYNAPSFNDDIIAVRKVNNEPVLIEVEEVTIQKAEPTAPQLIPEEEIMPEVKKVKATLNSTIPSTVMFFILAKGNRQFAGYELLQTVLAAGLRFGEGHLFHRHQLPNGQGPVLCSLAAATATGVFDLQNIGAFSVRGLCLFMNTSTNSEINQERFSILLETARQLSEGMDAQLLDEQRKPLTARRIADYCRILNIQQEEFELATA